MEVCHVGAAPPPRAGGPEATGDVGALGWKGDGTPDTSCGTVRGCVTPTEGVVGDPLTEATSVPMLAIAAVSTADAKSEEATGDLLLLLESSPSIDEDEEHRTNVLELTASYGLLRRFTTVEDDEWGVLFDVVFAIGVTGVDVVIG